MRKAKTAEKNQETTKPSIVKNSRNPESQKSGKKQNNTKSPKGP